MIKVADCIWCCVHRFSAR